MANTFDRLSLVVHRELGVDMEKLPLNASLVDLADSLDWVGLLSALEDEFGLKIEDQQAMQLHTFSDLLHLVGEVSEQRYATA